MGHWEYHGTLSEKVLNPLKIVNHTPVTLPEKVLIDRDNEMGLNYHCTWQFSLVILVY